jgi:hypothetical protein
LVVLIAVVGRGDAGVSLGAVRLGRAVKRSEMAAAAMKHRPMPRAEGPVRRGGGEAMAGTRGATRAGTAESVARTLPTGMVAGVTRSGRPDMPMPQTVVALVASVAEGGSDARGMRRGALPAMPRTCMSAHSMNRMVARRGRGAEDRAADDNSDEYLADPLTARSHDYRLRNGFGPRSESAPSVDVSGIVGARRSTTGVSSTTVRYHRRQGLSPLSRVW